MCALCVRFLGFRAKYGRHRRYRHCGGAELGAVPPCAGVTLIKQVGAEVVEVACVLELKELKGRDKLGVPLFAIALLSEFTDEAAADGAH